MLGFVFNTSVSVARMTLAGVFERLPELMLILGAVTGILGDTAVRLFPRLARLARQEAAGD